MTRATLNRTINSTPRGAEMPKPPEPAHPLATCKPRFDKLVVRRDLPPKQTAGGIHLPDAKPRDQRQQTGTVVSVGPDVFELKAGDRVVIAPYTGAELNGSRFAEEYAILKDEEVLAVLPAGE